MTSQTPAPVQRPLLFICGDLNNFGDLALLSQNLLLARKASRPAIVRYWTTLPEAVVKQVEAMGGTLIGARDTAPFLRMARGCDMVIGGGQMIRDNIGLKALGTLLLAAIAVRAGGGSVMTRGLGVSIISSGVRHLLWRGVLGRAYDVKVRDERSFNAATALLGAKAHIVLTADMAFLPGPLHDSLHATPDICRHIVIAPCDDASEERCFGGPLLGPVIEALAQALPDAKLSVVPHDIAPGMDIPVCERLAVGYAGADAAPFVPETLEALLGHYGQSAAILTNRLHAAIFGVLSGRPVIVADDGTGKLRALAEMFGLTTIDLRAPAGDGLPADWATTALSVDAEARRTKIAELSARALVNIS